ncbi:hypothetical protein NBRC110019_16110 [Neptunitalea chrysea]|uniref:VWFA domain-containing protein n=1 Tax=Neptunitalea chrysea TaxID=1647581 RepID=A0A9W6B4V0_9FLAO|nr:VWA domain-containing protein [Neptunitalea chrysea]GLB52571.1 hypothetical protein NBRC110019_16110 [Neptunitalea chrysea]
MKKLILSVASLCVIYSCGTNKNTEADTTTTQTSTTHPIVTTDTPPEPPEINEVVNDEEELMEDVDVGDVAFMKASKSKRTLVGKNGYMYSNDYNTEEYEPITENEFKEVLKNPLSTFSADVDGASYSNTRRFISRGQLPPKDAVRIEEFINYFDYDYKNPTGNNPFSINTEVSECPWNPGNRLVHIGLQGKKIATDNLPKSNLVFLLDVSGSMDAPDKLPLLKSSFNLLLDQLGENDRIAVVVYAGAAGVVLPSTSCDDKETIIDAINKLDAGGSTAGGEGIQLAYKIAQENFIKGGNNRIILATDGDFNIGTSSNAELVRLIEEKRKSGVFLSVLGFGSGNYKDSKMEQLADKGNGNYNYIDNLFEAKKVLVNEMGGTMMTIAKDVKIQIEFNPAKVAQYRLIGYENRKLNNEDFNDDTKDAGEIGSGHTVTALYEIVPVGKENSTSTDYKYLQTSISETAYKGNELATVKFRYKAPNSDTSSLLEQIIKDNNTELSKTSDNFRFSAAVAEFGLLLRDSKFKGSANYPQLLELAKGAKGKDEYGYRIGFITMAESSQSLRREPY